MKSLIEQYNSPDFNIKNNKGLYIYGPFNSGKTFMLKVLAKMLLQCHIPFYLLECLIWLDNLNFFGLKIL
uniref:Uncharacterized protein n=1 Tax=Candidatus Phytoplasma australasiaticum subsp. australasiaticum TaxID=2832407 RepID=A0A7S7FZ58_9MOLU|nr:hypothetical protein H7685_01875 ['Parthenium hysterophorus' phyllody phytoplasma]